MKSNNSDQHIETSNGGGIGLNRQPGTPKKSNKQNLGVKAAKLAPLRSAEPRYYCTYCGKKRKKSMMKRVFAKLTRKYSWVCKTHKSQFLDVVEVDGMDRKPVLVEMFSGSGHIAAAARRRGFDTVTIDLENRFNPDICIDILNLRRSMLPENVDIVWASIPCTVYSVLSIATHWDKIEIGYRQYYYLPKTDAAIEALKILNKVLELVLKLNPDFYFFENPRGALRHFPQMVLIPYRKTVSYADFGFDYYKPTDIFTNCPYFAPKEIKSSQGKMFDGSVLALSSAYERSLIPPKLIECVLDSVGFMVRDGR